MTAFSGMSRDPGEVQARIDQWAQGFAEKAQRYQAARQQTEQLRLTAASRDGVVRVTVGADGNITALDLSKKVRSIPPEELSAQILDTMRRAQSGIAERVAEVMAEQLGEDDVQTRTAMLDNLRTRFPEQDADEHNPSRPSAQQGSSRDADEDDEDGLSW